MKKETNQLTPKMIKMKLSIKTRDVHKFKLQIKKQRITIFLLREGVLKGGGLNTSHDVYGK